MAWDGLHDETGWIGSPRNPQQFHGTNAALTHFFADLPIKRATVIPADDLSLSAAPASIGRMLLAEDDILSRMNIADALRAEGWEIVEVARADDALVVLSRDQHFQMVLTDVHMPGAHTGLDVAREVKQSHSHIKVAVMSGNHLPSGDDRHLYDVFLQKPIPDIYPASKVAAEKLLRESGLNWTILRFPFVYGDGHLEMLPKHLVTSGFHPANRMSTIHHCDIATAMTLALAGAFDGRIVDISDEAPTTVYELAGLVGHEMGPSAEAMQSPWYFHVDASLARSLGFQPSVRTVYQAVQEGMM